MNKIKTMQDIYDHITSEKARGCKRVSFPFYTKEGKLKRLDVLTLSGARDYAEGISGAHEIEKLEKKIKKLKKKLKLATEVLK